MSPSRTAQPPETTLPRVKTYGAASRSHHAVLAAVVALVLLSRVETLSAGVTAPWTNPNASPQERAAQLLAAMTVEQKERLLTGQAVSELGVPAFIATDGPNGIR